MREDQDNKNGTNDPTVPESGEELQTPDNGTGVTEAGARSEVQILAEKIAELQKLADAYKDQLLRKAAEFDNYKRRTEAEYLARVLNANESLILSLIPILDDFNRSLKSGKEQKDYDSFYKGVELVYNKFVKVLEGEGLTTFESVGKPFDVDYHDALMQVHRNDVPPHTVIEEVEKGYKLNDKILRHAKVIVSTQMEPETEPDSTSQDNQATGTE
jgi:molecular chaperone GrpE